MSKYKSLTEMLNDTSSEISLNQIMSLNEMAQINIRETQKGKKHLDEGSYYVYVKGEGGYKKFHHFHIRNKANGWDIRMNMDGSFHSIKTRGKGMQNPEDAIGIENIAKEWVKEKNALDPTKTNGEVAEMEWIRNNS